MDSVSSRSSSTISGTSSPEPDSLNFPLTLEEEKSILEAIFKKAMTLQRYRVIAEKIPENHSHVIVTVLNTIKGTSQKFADIPLDIYMFTAARKGA
ncbi:MAG: hypothetical protein FJZ59_05245 [Chlamydiae bacterium]|jgi:hypothetical protein|nr:hypothetical protein [Chlamydiota bacterium]